jgi:chorismate mutase/prephenate dehydratase
MTGEAPREHETVSNDPLLQCRQDIDRVDAVLVALLRERARLALDAGRLKTAAGASLRAPGREAAVIDRVRRLAGAPLDGDAVARIFRRIIDETRAAEERWVRPTT